MDPRLLAVIGVLFLGIGGFSFVLAQKRMRYARMQGQPTVWYKNLTLMTSIEYILLGIIIFLNIASNWVSAQLRPTLDILYTIILILAIVFLLAVVFLGFKQPRRTQVAPQSAANTKGPIIETQSAAERNAEQQRKRERRQKAAEARRRRAGRA
jgi:uncharacterized protein HemX